MESANNKYVLWRRVSTKEQANTELGLDAQIIAYNNCFKSVINKEREL